MSVGETFDNGSNGFLDETRFAARPATEVEGGGDGMETGGATEEAEATPPRRFLNKRTVAAILCVVVLIGTVAGVNAYNAYQAEQQVIAINTAAEDQYARYEERLAEIQETMNGDFDLATAVQASADTDALLAEIDGDRGALTYSGGDTQLYDKIKAAATSQKEDIRAKALDKVNEHIAGLTVDVSTASKEEIQKSIDALNAYLGELDADEKLKGLLGAESFEQVKQPIIAKMDEGTAKVDEMTRAEEEEAVRRAGEERQAQVRQQQHEQQQGSTLSDGVQSGRAQGGQVQSGQGNRGNGSTGTGSSASAGHSSAPSSSAGSSSASAAGSDDPYADYRPSYEELVAQGIHVGGDTSYEALKQYYPWI